MYNRLKIHSSASETIDRYHSAYCILHNPTISPTPLTSITSFSQPFLTCPSSLPSKRPHPAPALPIYPSTLKLSLTFLLATHKAAGESCRLSSYACPIFSFSCHNNPPIFPNPRAYHQKPNQDPNIPFWENATSHLPSPLIPSFLSSYQHQSHLYTSAPSLIISFHFRKTLSHRLNLTEAFAGV